MVTVMIVDDHPLFTKGLSVLIGANGLYEVVGEATNGAEALAILEDKKPSLAIVDLNLGKEDGLDLIKTMKRISPKLAVLVLSMLEESYYAERALAAGALGYIMKEEVSDTVFDAIKAVSSGKIWLSERERNRAVDRMIGNKGSASVMDSVSTLSDRQLQIFTLVGKGFTPAEIASRINVSTKTVESHQYQIKLKLRCASAQELRRLAIEWCSSQTRAT